MNMLTGILRTLTAAALAPFSGLPPIVPLVFYSLVMGALAALAFRYTSNQTALKRVADKITASLLALRLYKDDTVVTFRAIGGLLQASLARLWYSLAPMAILLVPFVLIIAQFAMYYEMRPLQPGERALVQVRVDPARWAELRNLELIAPDGVEVLVRNADPGKAEIVWGIEPKQPLDGALAIAVGGETVEKQLVVSERGDRLGLVSPMRAGPISMSGWDAFWSSFGTWLLYPGEPSFGSSDPIQGFTVNYQPRSTPIFGLEVHWLITILVASILGALAVAPFLKVQF